MNAASAMWDRSASIAARWGPPDERPEGPLILPHGQGPESAADNIREEREPDQPRGVRKLSGDHCSEGLEVPKTVAGETEQKTSHIMQGTL